jgi:DNA-binding GntR family transcriptional regulator
MAAFLESLTCIGVSRPDSPGSGGRVSRQNNPERKVCTYVLDRIAKGEYLPGQRINEYDLARSLQLTKEQVREAMRNLIYLGLVERVPNKGVRMKHISLRDLEEIYQARQSVELETIRQVANTVTDDQLAELKTIADACVFDHTLHDYAGQFGSIQQSPSAEVSLKLKNLFPYYGEPLESNPDLEFHLSLVRFMGNRVWNEMALTIIPRAIILFQHYFFLLPHSIVQMVFQHVVERVFASGHKPVPHGTIYAAIADRDAKRAEELMREHLRFCYLINKAKIELYEDIARDQRLIGAKHSILTQGRADDEGTKRRRSGTSVGFGRLRGRRTEKGRPGSL